MNRILSLIAVIGAAGYLTSLALYILTFWDIDSMSSPVYGPLTIVLFGTWILAIIKLIRDPYVRDLQNSRSKNPIKFLKVIFQGTPSWVQVIAGISFIFSMMSFGYLMFTQPGVVDIIDGQKVLHNHGSIIKELTDQEYQHELAVNARKFLGHNLAFFGVGTAILYPNKNEEKNP